MRLGPGIPDAARPFYSKEEVKRSMIDPGVKHDLSKIGKTLNNLRGSL